MRVMVWTVILATSGCAKPYNVDEAAARDAETNRIKLRELQNRYGDSDGYERARRDDEIARSQAAQISKALADEQERQREKNKKTRCESKRQWDGSVETVCHPSDY